MANSRFRKAIQSIAGYQPGLQLNLEEIVKINTNESPYPPSPNVNKVLNDLSSFHLNRYPDPLSNRVRDAASALYGKDRNWILAGNGSDDILTIAVRSFVDQGGTIASLYPSYSLYEVLAGIQGAQMRYIELDNEFDLPTDIIQQAKGADLLFIVRPNSPTGKAYDIDTIRSLCEAHQGMILIDEAYADFADDNCSHLVDEFENVIVSKTLSKSYGLAAIRLGYALAQPQVIEGMMKVRDSYNVNLLTQLVGEAALQDQEHLVQTTNKIKETRKWLSSALIERGFELIESSSNFLFAKPPCDPQSYYQMLFDRKILIRYFSSPRCKDYVRISVGSKEEMQTFINVSDQIFTKK